MAENVITIVGNLADDPELRFTPGGVAVANIRVAVNRRFRNNQTGQWDERLDGFFTVNIWRDQAENVAESLQRGSRVLVTGRLVNRSFETQNKETRWVTEIEADEVCPSLRWATASIQKVNRNSGQGGQGGGQGGGQQGQGGAPQGGQQPTPPNNTPPEPEDVPF